MANSGGNHNAKGKGNRSGAGNKSSYRNSVANHNGSENWSVNRHGSVAGSASNTSGGLSEFGLTSLSADDIALIAGVLVLLADAVALWAILKARDEKAASTGGNGDGGSKGNSGTVGGKDSNGKGSGGRGGRSIKARTSTTIPLTRGRSFRI